MKKSMKIALSFLLVWAAILPSFVHSDSVAAASNVYEDGEYDIPFDVLKEDNDDISSAGSNIVSPGALTIVDGKYEVTVTMTETNYFKDFLTETEQLGSFEEEDFAEVETVSVDGEKDERVVKFIVQDLDEISTAQVAIHTPLGEMNHNIRLSFDTIEIDVLPDSDDTGEHDIPFDVLTEDSDDISSAGGNIVSPGALTIVDGKYEVTVTMTETNYFKDFLIETEQLGSFEDKDFAEVETVSVDEEKDERVVKFMVQDLDEILNAKVGIHTPMGEMNHNIRLSFDTSEIDVLPDSDDDTGEYDIPFEVLKEENDDISSAGSNIVSPGALAIVDGKYEVTVTMTETNYFKDFLIETEQLGSFEDEDFAEVERAEE